ncbi:MAG TPA: serine hydrolase domain-containing protein, partial [Pseudolabrys sp.]|nr:serine hydrolase domain-containing protein [Pseudolabrys sp.]
EDPDNGVLTSSHCERPADAVAIFAKEPLLFRPGTQYCDSTFGWLLLSAVVEAAADIPFATFLNERVFRPLRMVDTFKESVTNPPSDAATSYNPRFAAKPTYGLTPLPKFDYSCHAGSNGFLSTPSDLVRFGMAINRGKLLRPQTVEMLQTRQRLTSGDLTSYGLATFRRKIERLSALNAATEPTRFCKNVQIPVPNIFDRSCHFSLDAQNRQAYLNIKLCVSSNIDSFPDSCVPWRPWSKAAYRKPLAVAAIPDVSVIATPNSCTDRISTSRTARTARAARYMSPQSMPRPRVRRRRHGPSFGRSVVHCLR